MTRGAGLAFVSYAAVTVALAFPLIRDLANLLPSDLGDPVLNAWLLWWNATGVPFTERWWSPPVYFPWPDVLTYSEHLFGESLLSTPVYWLTGSPVAAYNVAFLLSFPLCGLSAYWLGLELTGRRDAAWLAGLAFAFAPYRMDHLSHLQVLSAYWMPLGLVALHRYYREARRRWLGLFGLSVVMTGLCNGYYLLFYPVLVGLWVLWFTPNEAWWRRVASVGLTGVCAVAVLTPSLLTYQRAHDAVGLSRGAAEIRSFSADVSGLVSGPPRSALWRFPAGVRRAEGQLFPGLTVVVLIGLALWRVRWRPTGPEPRALRLLRWGVGGAGLLLGLAVLGRLVFGPWEVSLLGLSISVDRPANVIAQGMLFWVFSLVLSPVGAWAYRRHSVFAFYCLAAFVLFVFSLGPEPNAFGHDFMAHSAYKALMWLPGYDGLRVPARFWMLVTLCLSALVALSFVRLTPGPTGARRTRLVTAIVAVGLLADGWVVWPTAPAPARASILDGVDGVVLELPLNRRFHDLTAMFRSISHRQPLVNGFSGYSPPHYFLIQYLLDQKDPRVLDFLAGLGVRYVRVDRQLDDGSAFQAYVAAAPGSELVAETDQAALYRLASRPDPRRPVTYGPRLDIVDVVSEIDAGSTHQVQDGSLETRWEGGPQRPGQQIDIQLQEAAPVGAVVTALGPYRTDHPRRLVVELSLDGNVWDVAWQGRTDFLALAGAFAQPRELPIVIPLEGRLARYIRLRSTASDPVYYWSIAELWVVSPEREPGGRAGLPASSLSSPLSPLSPAPDG